MSHCSCPATLPAISPPSLPVRRFKKAVEKGEFDEQERQRAHARACLERYMHYWHRWAENDASRKKVCVCVGGRSGAAPEGFVSPVCWQWCC